VRSQGIGVLATPGKPNPQPPTPFPRREGGASLPEVRVLQERLDHTTRHPFEGRGWGLGFPDGENVYDLIGT